MKLFINKILRFAGLLGILLLIAFSDFRMNDPFKIFDHNDVIDHKGDIPPNRDFMSTELLMKKRRDYNSFIFGSSRTLGFPPSVWKKYLPPTAEVFSFDANAETIEGIGRKLVFIERSGYRLDNALVVLCPDATFQPVTECTGHLYEGHPLTTHDPFSFYGSYFRSYLQPEFILYRFGLGSLASSKEKRRIDIDTVTNELRLTDLEARYEEYVDTGKLREYELTIRRDQVQDRQLASLRIIKEIFDRCHTNFVVISSPLYTKYVFSEGDLKKLVGVFGKRFFDLSGVNKYTVVKSNYYEDSHFRPRIGDSILSSVYRELNTHP